ncbi:MAG TPA: glycoside hydrolase family 38 C-terminal domain-containing protein [Candidatus Marinimicrobia bacterium]|jgi:hypothetical protein|nr:glycoside hydrolase family 38 C-terminal domain-containing protein [Candidatus Neomarinimicrobiota bacterium]HJM85389.1 glycoside hydrolase family 38 C-terminal domain-containing protein [Candidatus Neomarinimicrobiota bacterium]|tara:strand:- start:212 stop:3595 length:3384 start_codon:yes stop_codon:yes gene_type:complete
MKQAIVLLLIFSGPALFAQSEYFQGYIEKVSGTDFTYHSPLPHVTSSLISRANKNFSPVEWKTEIVPEDYSKKTITFIWVYGMDVLVESEQFDMYVNGQKWFSFFNPLDNEARSWSAKNDNGAELTFIGTMIDKHKDQMGFATLNLPTSTVKKGEQITLKVDGADKGSNAWYMTYKTELKEEIRISQNKVVAKNKGKLQHVARFDFTHLGDPVNTVVTVGDMEKTIQLQPGHNALDLELPKVDSRTEFTAMINVGGDLKDQKFWLEPIKEWTIYMVQHTHTDIGYTRPQTEVLTEHLRYIDNALDYCDQTDDYPDDAKFRWTCEASWAVREYLKSRPEKQIERLLRRIKEGRIEVTGMFFNFSEIIDETALAIQTKTLKSFKDRGIDVKTAMQNDVNGIGWCMIDFYDNTSVKYLNMGQHGHRAQIPFDKPTSFWWEAPSGNKLLAYRSEHYMHGNALALTSGMIDVFRTNLSNYLESLEKKNYPFDRTAFQFSGYITDNSPPSTIACDIVKEWNEKYEWPKLRIALVNEFLIYLDENQAENLPSQQVAWPDWWSDGFGSSMNETKAARSTHVDMIANTGLLSMAKIMGAELPEDINADINECYDNLLFYDEHTFGAAESIRDPLSENQVIQWGGKSAYAWTAVQMSGLIREKAMGLIQPLIERSDVPTIAVFNTLNWNRSGLVEVFIDHDILPTNRESSITDAQGKKVEARLMSSRPEGSYWNLWVENIPAMGYKILRIQVGDQLINAINDTSPGPELENAYYQLKIDRSYGVVTSLFDKELQIELLDKDSTIKLGEFIYERLENREAMERLTNTNRDSVYVPLNKKLSSLTDVKVSEIEEGPLWKSVKIHGLAAECADNRGVNIEIRLYNEVKRIEILYGMHKLQVTEPEGVYVAFPFELNNGHLAFEVQGGTISPGENQLEGTSSDWNVIQNFAAVRNQESQIIFSSNDAHLVQFGAINTGRYYYKHKPKTTHIYSWVLNNYWTTNFKASQEGEMKWKYIITSSNNNSNSFANRVGWGNRIPLLSRVIRSGGPGPHNLSSKSYLDLDIPNLLLVSAKPSEDGTGIILHLRETEGNHAVVDVSKLLQQTGAESISEVNVLEEEMNALEDTIEFDHFESKFIKLKM